jgi:uncharacterized protein (DUF1684 family)
MARNEYLELIDWRRRVAILWAEWREAAEVDPVAATHAFRAAKDRLFAEHPQSPLLPEHRAGFTGLDYWPYDPDYRMTVRVEPFDDEGDPHRPSSQLGGGLALPSSGPGAIAFRRVARLSLEGPLEGQSLAVYWVEGYGDGLFVPFRDLTSGSETYGAGRYLLDTVKGADHGGDPVAGTLLLDFNLAFHPSCAYDPRWSCPLAPPENVLPVPVPAGERMTRSDP